MFVHWQKCITEPLFWSLQTLDFFTTKIGLCCRNFLYNIKTNDQEAQYEEGSYLEKLRF